MASNSREEILAHALDIIRGGGAISFDSVAQSSGLSKPGLMYHFRTKEALMLGLVDHVADEWQREMDARLTSPFQGSTMRERAGIYVEACVTREPDPADIVMLTDPRLRQSSPPGGRSGSRPGSWASSSWRSLSADTSQLFGCSRTAPGSPAPQASTSPHPTNGP